MSFHSKGRPRACPVNAARLDQLTPHQGQTSSEKLCNFYSTNVCFPQPSPIVSCLVEVCPRLGYFGGEIEKLLHRGLTLVEQFSRHRGEAGESVSGTGDKMRAFPSPHPHSICRNQHASLPSSAKNARNRSKSSCRKCRPARISSPIPACAPAANRAAMPPATSMPSSPSCTRPMAAGPTIIDFCTKKYLK